MAQESTVAPVEECACGENCQCAEKKCKCHEVAHCAYKVAKLMAKVATVCAICHVAKELHKLRKTVEHKHPHLI